MQVDSKLLPKIQSVSASSLIDFRHRIFVPRTRAAQRLIRRFGLAPATADVVAELAGLGERGAQ